MDLYLNFNSILLEESVEMGWKKAGVCVEIK